MSNNKRIDYKLLLNIEESIDNFQRSIRYKKSSQVLLDFLKVTLRNLSNASVDYKDLHEAFIKILDAKVKHHLFDHDPKIHSRIDYLDISPYLIKSLKKAGINYTEELVQKTAKELIHLIPQYNTYRMWALNYALEAKGLKLKEDETP